MNIANDINLINDNKSQIELPFISVCTPTYNRRPFIKLLINCFNNQTYPKNLIEWIIIDDGTDKIEDLINTIPQVKYFKYDTKLTIGKKRNIMNNLSTGEIIIYMDDDDYYPPERIEYSVKELLNNKNILCAGSSILLTYFIKKNELWKFGPIHKNHATAGTLVFKKELLKITSFNDESSISEEKYFLKDFTIPLIQLDPFKTIICISHNNNTFDKNILLNNPILSKGNRINININIIINDKFVIEFLNNIRLSNTKHEISNTKDEISKLNNKKQNKNRNFSFKLFI
jgi:glycosyltransferase involved in cell wall biosynthesis